LPNGTFRQVKDQAEAAAIVWQQRKYISENMSFLKGKKYQYQGKACLQAAHTANGDNLLAIAAFFLLPQRAG
jgi:hypothetical protein